MWALNLFFDWRRYLFQDALALCLMAQGERATGSVRKSSQNMVKKKIGGLAWRSSGVNNDFEPVLERYVRYLKGRGFSETSIERYASTTRSFLKFAGDAHPVIEQANEFRDHIIEKGQSRATINNTGYALNHFFVMSGEGSFKPKVLRADNTLPYYFTEEEVHMIFDAARNLKHLAMLQVMFFSCLRASELCALEDRDVDLKNLSVRVRLGKGRKDGISFITPQCAKTLRRYLDVRPDLEIEGRKPLFYTDYGNWWDRVTLHRMFILIKKRAGLEDKPGGPHTLGRHTPATIMIAKGADIRVVQTILRHNDIRTTMRYAHVGDSTKRVMYDKFLTI
jgi:integrase/recombinase XerD